jgi:wyosine [tRNA(Phe)-imidazoG37] synthetase (radical SAM superfamily)
MHELETYLATSPTLDFITFSGSGEPTLSLDIGLVIRFLKERFPEYRVAVLTNGSLLSDSQVRQDILNADVVLPTLSTVHHETFVSIHRPALDIRLESILEGMILFRHEFTGEIWLEVFIIPGVNLSSCELSGMRDFIKKLAPDRIQINSLDRPGTESWVRPLSEDEFNQVIAELGGLRVNDADFRNFGVSSLYDGDQVLLIQETLKRRPCTVQDLVSLTGMHTAQILKILHALSKSSNLQNQRENRGVFYYYR